MNNTTHSRSIGLLLGAFILLPASLLAQSFTLVPNSNFNSVPIDVQEAEVAWLDIEGDGDLDFIYT
ncbi:MAG: hypothetical protein AAFQ68_23240, partial [Bacteroidota bacterium]